MNPPTTPPPLPFAELLLRAKRMKSAHFDITKDFVTADANAELIMRLLSWAHAGGVEELRTARDFLTADSQLGAEIDRSLALLDGQREET